MYNKHQITEEPDVSKWDKSGSEAEYGRRRPCLGNYNYLLKCFVLIDLKVGDLTHQDIGQIDGYVRIFEEQLKTPGDNPTIGLILCSDKDDAIAHYSVLKEDKKLFASRYKLVLPDEEELRREIERERRLIESTGTLAPKKILENKKTRRGRKAK